MLTNRKSRRKAESLARKARKTSPNRGSVATGAGLCLQSALLGTAAAGFFTVATPQTAMAGPDACVTVGTVATCQGNQSAGIASGVDFAVPAVTTLNVNSLNQTIAPAVAVDGINFTSTAGFTINSDTDSFGIVTQGSGDGIDAVLNANGNVTVNSTGNIQTFQGEAITASINGNGDLVIVSTGNLTTGNNAQEGIDADVNGNGNLTITSVGNITTGNSSQEGIDADVNGSGNLTITSTGDIVTGNNAQEGIDADVNGNGNLTVVSMGNITTGAGAQETIELDLNGNGTLSLTSTGNLTSGGNDAIDIAVNGNGTLTVTSSGNLITSSNNYHGVLAYVQAGSTATINLSNGTTQGGGGTGAGVNFTSLAGATNVVNTSGTVTLSSLGGVAINGGPGNTTVNNSGVLNTITNGAIQLGGGTNTFNNMGGGIFNSGGVVNLGAGNFFNNSGTFSPGSSGAIQTTAITGNLVQNGGGIFLATVDPSAVTGDLVTVTGTANLAGNVQAAVVNPALGAQSQTILTATGGTTNNGLGLLASPALQASLSFPNANDVVLNTSIDFSAGGLNPNQTALAVSLNSATAAGVGDLNPVLSALLNNVFTIGDYRNALNQLLPEVMLNNETATLFSAEGFVDNLFSCRLAGDNHTALSEGECLWARPQGRFLDRDSDANTVGFDETAGGLAAGGQVAVAPNWFAGFALGYERASLETDTGAETDSNRFSGGLSLKYQAGSFLLGAAISGGVSGNDTERAISIGGAGGFNATAESNYAIKTLTGQARAAYVFQLRDWFAKPLVDVTATYLSRNSATESGAGAANLAIGGSDETFFSFTPALEIGGDFALSDTSTIRPYVRAGVSFYTDSDHGLTASFVNAPAGTSAFSITSEFDDVFADVAAGATAFFVNGSTLGLSYEGLISSDTQQHGISLKGSIAF